MGKLTGLLMIVAGVGTAAYVYPMIGSAPDKAEKHLADVVAITTSAEPKRQAAPVVIKQFEQTGSLQNGASRRVISAETTDGRAGLAAVIPAASAPLPAQPSIVAAAPSAVVKPVEAPVPQPVKRVKTEDEGKAALTRDIQRELKRVGCLQSDADGSWNAATKQAMKQFIDRVNATLPTDEPDHILKTLVQGHPGNACGKSCPSGQSAATDGRCLPTAIMAQAPTPVKRTTATAETVTPGGAQFALKTAPAPSVAPVPQPKATSAWETSVTTASSTLADLKPLPGRMAMGAATETQTATSPSVTATAKLAQDDPPKTRFVVKPKAPVAKVEPEKANVIEKPVSSEKSETISRPAVGAVAAAERFEPPARTTAAPTPRVAIYRAPPPPPRYVGAYAPTPVRVSRPRFGPQIFRQLEASGR